MNTRHQNAGDVAKFRHLLLPGLFLLASLLAACGSDSSDDSGNIETYRYTAEYHNTDQPAQLLGAFLMGTPDFPAIGPHYLGSEEDLTLFAEEFGADFTGLPEFDLQSRDYFAVIVTTPCAKLVSREAFVKDNLFTYEVVYEFDDELVCPAVVEFKGFLFDVAKAP